MLWELGSEYPLFHRTAGRLLCPWPEFPFSELLYIVLCSSLSCMVATIFHLMSFAECFRFFWVERRYRNTGLLDYMLFQVSNWGPTTCFYWELKVDDGREALTDRGKLDQRREGKTWWEPRLAWPVVCMRTSELWGSSNRKGQTGWGKCVGNHFNNF